MYFAAKTKKSHEFYVATFDRKFKDSLKEHFNIIGHYKILLQSKAFGGNYGIRKNNRVISCKRNGR